MNFNIYTKIIIFFGVKTSEPTTFPHTKKLDGIIFVPIRKALIKAYFHSNIENKIHFFQKKLKKKKKKITIFVDNFIIITKDVHTHKQQEFNK